MITSLTVADLIAFEEEAAAEFNAGKIPYPVHLESGNEHHLIRVFKDIGPDDWLCGSWRQHLKCLLKGVPRDELLSAIRRGESIALNFPEYRIVSSAIVGGILPIAVGIALSIKRRGGKETVHAFMGDMTSTTGIAHECMKYAEGHALPVRWIIEDDDRSVCTPTRATWGGFRADYGPIRYRYESHWPHAGAGVRVQF